MRHGIRGMAIGGVLTVAIGFVTAAVTSGAGGNVLHVPGDFATIQTAVDAAQPGDTVLVAAGVYSENVVVATSGVRLQGGGDAVLDGAGLGGNGIGIHVLGAATAPVNVDKTAPAVTGDGFGIELTSASASDVSHNIISRNGFGGIRVGGIPGSTDNTIHHNRVNENGTASSSVARNGQGILLTGSSNNNEVQHNEILANNGRGVVMTRPLTETPISGILVAHNRLHGNERAGVAIMGAATGNIVEYNDARDNNLAGIGPCWRCNLFDNSTGRNGENIFRKNHGTYGIPGDACAVPQ